VHKLEERRSVAKVIDLEVELCRELRETREGRQGFSGRWKCGSYEVLERVEFFGLIVEADVGIPSHGESLRIEKGRDLGG
jgi:hypothetical protein